MDASTTLKMNSRSPYQDSQDAADRYAYANANALETSFPRWLSQPQDDLSCIDSQLQTPSPELAYTDTDPDTKPAPYLDGERYHLAYDPAAHGFSLPQHHRSHIGPPPTDSRGHAVRSTRATTGVTRSILATINTNTCVTGRPSTPPDSPSPAPNPRSASMP